MELVVRSNETDCKLAEIEGDAQAHRALRVAEGIKVAQFVKATALDMIVVHRLLKNDVASHEYILMTEPCCDAVGHTSHPALRWSKSSQAYDAIGTVNYEFATLSDYRGADVAATGAPRFVVEKGDDNLEIVIDAPLKAVYQTLINVDKRPQWLEGVDTINREMTSERIGGHNCVFPSCSSLCAVVPVSLDWPSSSPGRCGRPRRRPFAITGSNFADAPAHHVSSPVRAFPVGMMCTEKA